MPPLQVLQPFFLIPNLENQRKVPKNLLNVGVALSLYLACSPAPNVQLSCGPIPHVLCVIGADPCKVKKVRKKSEKVEFWSILEGSR